MELKIIIENENALFGRNEIEGEIKAPSAPSRDEVRKNLAQKYSVAEEVIKIRTIKGAYGSNIFLFVANIYKSKEDKDKVEKVKKKDLESEKRDAEAKAASEKPVEEIPEEVKEEAQTEEPREKLAEEIKEEFKSE